MITTREQRRQLERDNHCYPLGLIEVPRSRWPFDEQDNSLRLRVLRSSDFLVQEFSAFPPVLVRLTICRTKIRGDKWQDGIKWEDMQWIKCRCGYGDMDAVEIYPKDSDLVNVANMRHLWVMIEPLTFAWRKPIIKP